MVAVPPLGDVMQERRHEKRPPRSISGITAVATGAVFARPPLSI